MPRLQTMVADTTGLLKGGAIARLKKEIGFIQRRYPQLVVQIVMHTLPAEHPFAMHAFWLFNAGAFAGEGKRGKNNHALMILVDPVRCESAIVPGYGLEPLMGQEPIDHLLEMAGPSFEAQQWEAGLMVILDGLDGLLNTVSQVEDGIEYGDNDF